MREGETVTTHDNVHIGPDDLNQHDGQARFVGYGAAAEYLGLKRNTLSSYVARGIGPVPLPEKKAEGQYNLPVFTRDELDRWKDSRPGQGARTDLASVTA
jgi:hypothetical protein